MAKAKPIWMNPWLAGAAIVALTLAAYIPAMNGGFIWDDDLLLYDSPLIKASDGLYRFWFTAEAVDYFPLTWTSLWAEWRLWGTHPAGYHVTNILLHAASAVLLWRVLVRLGVPGAWLAGVLFAVHPVNVESVAWISERKNTLAMVFCLLAALAYLRSNRGARGAWYAACLVFFAMSLLSKPAAVMLPVALLVVTWWRRGRLGLRDLALAAPMLAMSLALGMTTLLFQRTLIAGELVRPTSEGLLTKLAISGMAVWFYLYKAVAPVSLAFIYPRWQVDGGSAGAYVPVILLLGCFAGLWTVRRTRWARAVLAALACFVIVLVPLLGFFDDPFLGHSLVADRHQYFALIAVFALAAAGAARLVGRPGGRRRRAGVAVAVAIVVALTALTWRRAGVFADRVALWQDAVDRNPDSWHTRNSLGAALMASDLPDRYDRARPHLARALELTKLEVWVWVNNGGLLYRTGRLREAVACCREALRLNPELPQVHLNMGHALLRLGEYEQAADSYGNFVRLRPQSADGHVGLGRALRRAGRVKEAAEHFARALKLDPNSDAAGLLGKALTEQGRDAEAVGHYRGILNRRGDDAEMLNDLAWLLATCPDEAVRDGPEAVRLAERACELTGRGDPAVLDTLAATYARAGRFDKAVRAAERAIRLAEAALSQEATEDEKTLLAEYRSRLELYRAKRPYRRRPADRPTRQAPIRR